MTNLKPFEFEGKKLTVLVDKQNVRWWMANDLCNMLGYANPRKSLTDHVDEDDVTKRDIIDLLGRKQKANFVNDSGMYSLVLSSTLPEAKRIKRWITSEVMPSIEKTGSYSISKPMVQGTPIRYQPMFSDPMFWEGVHKYMGVTPPADPRRRHPSCGKFILNQLYKPMGVDEELQKLVPRSENGIPKAKLHQMLTSEAGRPTLATLQGAFRLCAVLSQGNRQALQKMWDTYLLDQQQLEVQQMLFLPLVPETAINTLSRK